MSSKYYIQLGADVSQFTKGIDKAQAELRKFGKNMQQMGKSMSTYVTAPLMGIAALSVNAWDKQAQAIAQVEAGLKSTGNMVGFTSDELQKMASSLQNNSLFGDEEILQKVTAQMLTFTNVTGDAFQGAQQAVLDLSARLGTDLQSSAIMVGKALNDPILGITAMSRAGVQFTQDQKNLIKELVETGNKAEAQRIILKELEAQYGGSAKAASEVGMGPMIQLKNAIGDLSEEFGKIITEAIAPFIEWLKGLVQRVQNADESTKKWVVVIGALAAAIGPVMVALGTLSVIIAAINFKILAIVAAIGLFVAVGWYLYNNWESITNGIQRFFANMINGILSGLQSAVSAIQNTMGGELLAKIGVDFDGVNQKIENMKVAVPETIAKMETFAETLAGVKEALMPVNEETTKLKDTLTGGETSEGSVAESMEILGVKSIPEFVKAVGSVELATKGAENAANTQLDTSNAILDVTQMNEQAFSQAAMAYEHGADGIAKTAARSARQVISSQIAQGIAAEVSQAMTSVPFPFGLLAAAGAGAAASALFNAIIPKFANGGVVSGPTLGIMGEYQGARSNPEVIAPLDKLKSMIGTSVVVLETKIKGEDIYLTQERYSSRRKELLA